MERTEPRLGVLGGSGLYEMEGLADVREVWVDTPFGAPSDAVVTGRLGDRAVAFLPRHGRGHRVPPHALNTRANVYALKKLGVDWLLSVSAVGSLREDVHPGDVVVVDQFIDRTHGRPSTFFEDGIVAHVTFSDPCCAVMRGVVADAARAAGARMHDAGTYVCMNGPQFSTRAESALHRSWGAAVIGMTAVQEAKLAREAEMCFATVALATDYDCWHASGEEVSVAAVLEVLRHNVAMARDVVRRTAAALPAGARRCPCAIALEHAVMTAPDRIGPEVRARLAPLLARRDASAAAAAARAERE
ncbi:MAG TPA: S-methyl-5'-thioadenosine phosphorylase [Myxococcota bacterium]|jgi:5'-methylthioadenosine phosphorylase|nr:S-methyl-5'-thioadenosine phosphorylase [Myxococcota bacterium]